MHRRAAYSGSLASLTGHVTAHSYGLVDLVIAALPSFELALECLQLVACLLGEDGSFSCISVDIVVAAIDPSGGVRMVTPLVLYDSIVLLQLIFEFANSRFELSLLGQQRFSQPSREDDFVRFRDEQPFQSCEKSVGRQLLAISWLIVAVSRVLSRRRASTDGLRSSSSTCSKRLAATATPARRWRTGRLEARCSLHRCCCCSRFLSLLRPDCHEQERRR